MSKEDVAQRTASSIVFVNNLLVHITILLVLALDVSDDVALRNLRATLGVYLYDLAAQGCRNLNEFAPRSLDVAEYVALIVFLTDERLDCRSALALAGEFPVDVALDRSHDGIGLGVLVGAKLFG